MSDAGTPPTGPLISLPLFPDSTDVARPGRCSGAPKIRKSRMSGKRASVLAGVHLLVAAHVTHYLIAGRTLSPVEPSEAEATIELGYVTLGFLFFAAALLATLVFGRFFCGWGCHIVALQDLCGWIMKKLGVRPKPFRSRLLAFFPLLIALYMFAWPSVLRLLPGDPLGPFPRFTNHLLTNNLWTTFPGPVIGALTFLTCGFAAVYFLGAKGFCTYGCPYGALFGPIDTLAAGRIVVSDACEQCGHCTATCTSNVRVHEEVKLHGMVVDPGCMKCMDCVSVCPKGALRFAFVRPPLLRPAPKRRGSTRYDLPLAEELLLAATCLVATLVFLHLYDGPPLLMSAGLGVLTAYLCLKMLHLARRPDVRVQNLVLKSSGRLRSSGWIFAAAGAVWLGIAAHSALVQWDRARGIQLLNRIEAQRGDIVSGEFIRKEYSPRHYRSISDAYRHLSRVEHLGLVDLPEIELGLSWLELLRQNATAAAAHARRAVALTSAEQQGVVTASLFEVLMAGHRADEALDVQQRRIATTGSESAADRFRLGWALSETGRPQQALEELRACLAEAPDFPRARSLLADVLEGLGRRDEAAQERLLAAGGR